MAKPYVPLMVGDWLKGTRGMRAEARGVYLGLLLHQFEVGWIPRDMEELALIEPEVGKVWVSIKDKFEEIEPGKLRNKKLVDVLAFWEKQRGNGSKGGRPIKSKPKDNPNDNPNSNPNHNHHNDLDNDNDNVFDKGGTGGELNPEAAIDPLFLEGVKASGAYPGVDIDREVQRFILKVKTSPSVYRGHGNEGLKSAFLYQIKFAVPEKNGKVKSFNIDTI